jgi:hypothetical protein
MKPQKVKITFRSKLEASPVKIVWDGAVATIGVGEGRLIPLVIIDGSDRPDVEELIRVHQYLPPGDVESKWVQLIKGDEGKICLMLSFKRPVELVAILEFDIISQGGLIDQILTAKALYLQAGREGDRLATTIDSPRMSVEVPGTGFHDEWNRMFMKWTEKGFRQRGLNRQDAKRATREFIEKWRGSFGQFRMKGPRAE